MLIYDLVLHSLTISTIIYLLIRQNEFKNDVKKLENLLETSIKNPLRARRYLKKK